jgi:hypothetical protein
MYKVSGPNKLKGPDSDRRDAARKTEFQSGNHGNGTEKSPLLTKRIQNG